MTGALPHQQFESDATEDLGALSFDELLDQLEKVVQRLETDQLSLEASIDTYETGMRIAARCQELLANAELRISRITDESGTTEPWVAPDDDEDEE